MREQFNGKSSSSLRFKSKINYVRRWNIKLNRRPLKRLSKSKSSKPSSIKRWLNIVTKLKFSMDIRTNPTYGDQKPRPQKRTIRLIART